MNAAIRFIAVPALGLALCTGAGLAVSTVPVHRDIVLASGGEITPGCNTCSSQGGTNTRCMACIGKSDKTGCGTCGGGGWVWVNCPTCKGTGKQ